MSEHPQNELYWNQLRRQAQAMHPGHGKLGQLSPAASKWLRTTYMNSGGSFVGSPTEVPPQFQDAKQREADKEKRKAYEKKQEGNLGAYTSKAGSGL
jgi:hypothetical protein